MKAWVIYNGSLKLLKMNQLIEKLVADASVIGLELIPIKNNEIVPVIQKDGSLELTFLQDVPEPEFVIFWDKDILLASLLERKGYKLYNSAQSIEICDDKSLMHAELIGRELHMPKTIFGPFSFDYNLVNDTYLDYIFTELGDRLVLKESKGSFGMQVYMIDSREALAERIHQVGNRSFIMQEVIESSIGRDIRVNIVGDRVIGAMQRVNDNDFRANITNGGVGRSLQLTNEQEELALKAHAALGLTFSGVDLLYGPDEEPMLCEVNSNVNFVSFELATGLDYAKPLLRHLMENVR
ncbi:RimK family alpha-L-glutamate ligase [Chryseomicrobium palamuruense]|uniref:RimK family alpha-L-glutamate ligase n=1 Tax=Chryseomicrobium palamuruense TaxID=682973 RepID=A0ABV8UXJ0_9BACL